MEDIYHLSTKMKIKPTRSADGMSSIMLRNTVSSISPFLCKLFNNYLSTGHIPSDRKVSTIVPTPKGGDAAQCSNYRPISLLPLMSKILEIIVYNHLLDFLLKHKHLSPLQFGFRPNSLTQESLLSLTHDVCPQLDRGNHMVAIFFDLSKDFDTALHHLLLAALKCNGIEGLIVCWFQNYHLVPSQQLF